MSRHWPHVLITLLKSMMLILWIKHVSSLAPCVTYIVKVYDVDPVDQTCLIIGPMCYLHC